MIDREQKKGILTYTDGAAVSHFLILCFKDNVSLHFNLINWAPL